jgi:hypothetical protein
MFIHDRDPLVVGDFNGLLGTSDVPQQGLQMTN